MLNFRGREEDTRDERLRERFLFVEDRLFMREMGRERDDRIAVVVSSIEVRAVRN